MSITYDKKRRDITVCTIVFKLPGGGGSLNNLKSMDRKFEEFYLPSLKNLIETFGRIALWCDAQTADFIRANGLADRVHMRVMDFSKLPHYHERDEWLRILKSMQGRVGYLLRHKTPEDWLDYMTLIMAKPAVVDWAATENPFDTKYFMWIDAGSFNPHYHEHWGNWTGHIDARPSHVRITVAPTLGKSRPHFVPGFIYNIYRRVKSPIPNATAETLAAQDLGDIAMINADYDVPGGSFMMTGDMAHRFYAAFEHTRRVMKRHGLVSTEQAVFQAMMKFDVDGMFEISYIKGYAGVYAAVAARDADYIMPPVK